MVRNFHGNHSFLILVVVSGILLLLNTGKLAAMTSDPEMDSLHQLLSILPEDSSRANTLKELAWEQVFSNPDSARTYARASLKLAQSLDYQKGIGNGYNILAISFDIEGRYDSALYYFLTFLHFNQDLGDRKGIARATNNLSIVYQNLQEYQTALNYAKESYAIELEFEDTLGAAQSLTNIANQFDALGELDSAILYFNTSIKLYEQLGIQVYNAYNWEGLAEVSLKKHEYGRTIELLEQALVIWEAENIQTHEAVCHLLLGKAYMQLEQLDNSLFHLHKAESIAVPLGIDGLLMRLFESLSDWHEKQEEYPEALRYSQLHSKYKSLVFSEQRAKQLAAIEAQEDFVRQSEEIAGLNRENTIQQEEISAQRQVRNILFISTVLLLCFLMIMIRNYWRSVRTNKMLEIKREEIKKKNLEIVHQKYKALRASKAKSRFLAMMSHEIRTPMNAVIGITNLLLQENPRTDQEESLRTMKFSAENLLVLINDILDYNKIEAGKIEFENIPFDLRNLLHSLHNSMKGKAREKRLELLIELDEQLPNYIKGDPTRLAQILTNLLSNAIKFTDNGSVSLQVEVVGETEDVNHLAFTVADTGIGISKEKLGSIFDSFTQASSDITRRYGGTGLGLSITRKLIELQGSRIRVESEPGEGTRFYFTLGFGKTSLRPDPLQPTLPIPTRDLTGVQVLIAEDNQVNELVARRFLTKWGVEVDAVPDGLQAVSQVQVKDYDLVLMDLQMPVMDGFKATRRIRSLADSSFRALPIIALTASAMNEIRQKAFEAGVTDFVTKPFNPEELRAVLEKYVLRDDAELIGEEF
ncbi:MAG TPA: hypothetical protein DCE41_20760 [Cytophagales bacterium]|nr:hypothetical protein [Cytophagales bacterium]HAA17253.1 hypothetical protein [Cytophagales bacterium]HAP60502.1 hypothetical protein [Cytophagales bacterium]